MKTRSRTKGAPNGREEIPGPLQGLVLRALAGQGCLHHVAAIVGGARGVMHNKGT
jgi:hypothetical protein